MLVSHVEPLGQQAWQFGPTHRRATGQSVTSTASHVTGSVMTPEMLFAAKQLHGSTVPAGQQLPPGGGQTPRTQEHVPALQRALIGQRLPQAPQLRGSLLVSTQAPPQQRPPAHVAPSALGWHLPGLHRFLPCFLSQSPRLHVSHALHFGLHLPDRAAPASSA